MTSLPGEITFDDLGALGDGDVPRLRTELPGPRSVELWARDAEHHAANSSMAAQALGLVIRDGKGSLVRDVDGNVFVDFCSGIVVTNLGHSPTPSSPPSRKRWGG